MGRAGRARARVLVYAMDFMVLHLVVPHLSADPPPTSPQLLWIADISGFMVAGALITMATVGDRIGRRRLLLIGRRRLHARLRPRPAEDREWYERAGAEIAACRDFCVRRVDDARQAVRRAA
jgi:hypothetical protein